MPRHDRYTRRRTRAGRHRARLKLQRLLDQVAADRAQAERRERIRKSHDWHLTGGRPNQQQFWRPAPVRQVKGRRR